MRECESPEMDAIVGIAFSPGPHVSSSKLLWEVGNPFEGGNGGEERNTRKLCVILHLCRGGGSWGVLGRELPVGLLGRAGVVSAGRPYPGRGGRNTEYELAIPSMPSAISEGIVHATLAQRSRLTRAGVGRTIFLRTEAVPCSPAGIFDRIPRAGAATWRGCVLHVVLHSDDVLPRADGCPLHVHAEKDYSRDR